MLLKELTAHALEGVEIWGDNDIEGLGSFSYFRCLFKMYECYQKCLQSSVYFVESTWDAQVCLCYLRLFMLIFLYELYPCVEVGSSNITFFLFITIKVKITF